MNSQQFSYFFYETALPAFKALIGENWKRRPPYYNQLFDVQRTNRSIEQLAGITGFGLARPITELGDVEFDTAQQAFYKTYKPTRRGLAFRLSYETVKNNQMGLAAKFARELSLSIKETIEIEAAQIYNRAFATYTGPDGKVLCASDHPLVKKGGSHSNLLSVAAQLSYTSLKMALLEAESCKDDTGKEIHLTFRKLIVPRAYRFIAAQLLKSADDPTTANRATNVLRYAEDGMPEAFVYPYLTSTTAWFLAAEPADTGLVWLWRERPDVDGWMEKSNQAGITAMRYWADHGFHDWRGIFGTPGA